MCIIQGFLFQDFKELIKTFLNIKKLNDFFLSSYYQCFKTLQEKPYGFYTKKPITLAFFKKIRHFCNNF